MLLARFEKNGAVRLRKPGGMLDVRLMPGDDAYDRIAKSVARNVKAQGLLDLDVMEEGFTGEITDQIGRKYLFRDGKRVKRNADPTKRTEVNVEVAGEPAKVVGHDPATGRVKVKTDSGTKVVSQHEIDFGGGDEKSNRSGRERGQPTSTSGQGRIREPGGLRGGPGGVEPSGAAAPVDTAPLIGAPTKAKIPGRGEVAVGPDMRVRQCAADYMKAAGLSYDPPKNYVKVDKERAKRIADAYTAMQHAPDDPKVKAAYAKMAEEVIAQYKAALATGLKVEFIDFEKTGDPYAASPRLAIEDVKTNNHMWVFPTSSGFGSDASFDASQNPLLADTGLTISGKPACVNDVFRVVHDLFGHCKDGVGMRADGEENAWRSHSAMFSPLARAAMTSETRGQNSWVNFGPHGEANRTASGATTVYADQKVGLLPEWCIEEGTEAHDRKLAAAKDDYARNGTKAKAFKEWFGDWDGQPDQASKVVKPDGSPQETLPISGVGEHLEVPESRPVAVYHGTAHGGFSKFDKHYINPDNLYGPGFYFTEDPSLAEEYKSKDPQKATVIGDRKAAAQQLRERIQAAYENATKTKAISYVENAPEYRKMNDLANFYGDDLLLEVMGKDAASGAGKWWEGQGVKWDDVIQLSGEVKECYLNIRNPYDGDLDLPHGSPTVTKLADQLAKLLSLGPNHTPHYKLTAKAIAEAVAPWANRHHMGEYANTYRKFEDYLDTWATKADDTPSGRRGRILLNQALQALGYDGITHLGGHVQGNKEHRVWIAFEPNQIKSVGNRGTFDASSDNLLESGFTGEVVAKNGRKMYFRDGKPAKRGAADQPTERPSATLDGKDAHLIAHDPATGLVKVRTEDGEKVVKAEALAIGENPKRTKPTAATPTHLMTRKEFYKVIQGQHTDLRAFNDGTIDDARARARKIRDEGWSHSVNVNALPPTLGPPNNVIDKQYGTRKGALVYAVPKEFLKNGPNGLLIKVGWRPLPSQIIEPSYDYQPLHEAAVENALQRGDEVPEEVLADYPALAEKYAHQDRIAAAKKDYAEHGVHAKAFKAWFGPWDTDPASASKIVDKDGKPQKSREYSKVTDDEGNPVIVYHGTTHTFDKFDQSRTSVENHMGKGFYFTESTEDVEKNYAGEGPDLSIRISTRAEGMEGEAEDIIYHAANWHGSEKAMRTELAGYLNGLQWMTNEFKQKILKDYDAGELGSIRDYRDDVRNAARDELEGDNPHTLQCYLNIRKPIILGGKSGDAMDGTRLEIENMDSYDPEKEDSFPEEGSLIKAIREVATDHDEIEDDQLEDILMQLTQSGADSCTSDDFLSVVANLGNPIQRVDPDTGRSEITNSQFIADVFKHLGYDGVIYHDASDYFPNMGIPPGTRHFVAWKPNQIKAADNRGTFDPSSDVIYESHETNLLESGFTGEITDKIGRHVHFVDGKRVKWRQDDVAAETVGHATFSGRPVKVLGHDPVAGLLKVRLLDDGTYTVKAEDVDLAGAGLNDRTEEKKPPDVPPVVQQRMAVADALRSHFDAKSKKHLAFSSVDEMAREIGLETNKHALYHIIRKNVEYEVSEEEHGTFYRKLDDDERRKRTDEIVADLQAKIFTFLEKAGIPLPPKSDRQVQDEETAEQREARYKRAAEEREAERVRLRDAAKDFAEANYKHPPEPHTVNRKTWTAIRLRQKMAEVDRDFAKIGYLHRMKQKVDVGAGTWEEQKELEQQASWRQDRDEFDAEYQRPYVRKLLNRYKYAGQKRGDDQSLDGAFFTAGRMRDSLKGDWDEGFFEYSDTGVKAVTEHVETMKAAFLNPAFSPSEEVMKEYEYEDWLPQRYRDQKRTQQRLRDYEEYLKTEHVYAKGHLDAAMRRAAPKIKALMERADSGFKAAMESRKASEAMFAEAEELEQTYHMLERAVTDFEKPYRGPSGYLEIPQDKNEVYEALIHDRNKTEMAFVTKHQAAVALREEERRQQRETWLGDLLPKDPEPPSPVEHVWKKNNQGKWAWFYGEHQVSGASDSEADREGLRSTIAAGFKPSPRIEIPTESFLTDRGKTNVAEANAFLLKAVSAKWGELPAELHQLPEKQFRAHCGGNRITVTPGEPTWVLVHEFGHLIEHHDGSVLGTLSKAFAVQQLLDYSEKPEQLGASYEADEVGAQDGFQTPYTGKFYPYHSSEVLSMGLQQLYQDPLEFYQTSRKHFEYTMAALHGWLTRPDANTLHESLLLESGFTGEITDKIGRRVRFVDGKRVKRGSGEQPNELEHATVGNEPVHLIAHDPKKGLVKVQGASGTKVVKTSEVNLGGAKEPHEMTRDEHAKQSPYLHFTNSAAAIGEHGLKPGDGAFGPGTLYLAANDDPNQQMWGLRGDDAIPISIKPNAKVFHAKSEADLTKLAKIAGFRKWSDAERVLNGMNEKAAKEAKQKMLDAGIDVIDNRFDRDEYTPAQVAVINPSVAVHHKDAVKAALASGKQVSPEVLADYPDLDPGQKKDSHKAAPGVIFRGEGNNLGFSGVEGVQWWSEDPETAGQYGDVKSAKLSPDAKVLRLRTHPVKHPETNGEPSKAGYAMLAKIAKKHDIDFDQEDAAMQSGEELLGTPAGKELMQAIRAEGYQVVHTDNIEGPATMVLDQKAVQGSSGAPLKEWAEGSKVVDATGEPRKVFHGTRNDDVEFDDRDTFFASHPDDAEVHGKAVPVYLSLKNPRVVHTEYDPTDWLDGTDHEDIDEAHRDGNDGVIVNGKDGRVTYVTFKADQIRRA